MKKERPYGQAAGGRARRGGAKRAAAQSGKGPAKRKPPKGGTGSRLALALVTFLNLLLTLLLWVMNRRDVVHAIQTDEGVKLLLTRPRNFP